MLDKKRLTRLRLFDQFGVDEPKKPKIEEFTNFRMRN